MQNKTIKSVLYACLVVLMALMGYFVFLVINSGGPESPSLEESEDLVSSTPVGEEDYVIVDQINDHNEMLIEKLFEIELLELEMLKNQITHFAVFATDERADEIPRSDIIMILEYVPKLHKVTLISTPRDTRVSIPGRKYKDKINHAYAFGGPDLMLETLQNLYDVEIEYYVRMNFDNFVYFIDWIGGVEVNAKKDYEYPNRISIKKGVQLLDGKNALDYVRFRYDEDGDYGRIQRQQEIVKSLLDRMSGYNNEEWETNLAEFYSIVDTNMTIEEIRNLYRVYDMDKPLVFEAYTLKIVGRIINGIWYGIYEETNLNYLKDMMREVE